MVQLPFFNNHGNKINKIPRRRNQGGGGKEG